MSVSIALDPIRFENGPEIVCARCNDGPFGIEKQVDVEIPSPCRIYRIEVAVRDDELVALGCASGGLDPTLRRRLWQALTDAMGRLFRLHDR
jgi:hypothetical protein